MLRSKRVKGWTKKRLADESGRFIHIVVEGLIERGAVRTDTSYGLLLQTPLGPLHLAARANALEGPGTVYARFEKVQLAAKFIGASDMNPYSGKWNHHFWREMTPEKAAAYFFHQLNRVMSIELPLAR